MLWQEGTIYTMAKKEAGAGAKAGLSFAAAWVSTPRHKTLQVSAFQIFRRETRVERFNIAEEQPTYAIKKAEQSAAALVRILRNSKKYTDVKVSFY